MGVEAINPLLRRLKARLPVVPRSTRDALLADHEALQRRHDEVVAELAARDDLPDIDPDTVPFLTFAPPGHFYSPIPNMAEALAHVRAVFDDLPDELPGIDLRLDSQLDVASCIAPFAADFDAPENAMPGRRYHTANPSYGAGDGAVLEAMLRQVRPAKIIEIGSGFSSALMLDTIDRHLGGDVELTFIEPHAAVLRGLFHDGDADRCRIVEQPLQAVDTSVFGELGPGDVLFIDSTHVVRPGSDVLVETFEILPRLRPGAIVHLHDVFYPFEYPPPWVEEGRVWGEAYLLRAFLTHNADFEIMFWPHYVRRAAPERFAELFPRLTGEGFGAIWLRRVGDA